MQLNTIAILQLIECLTILNYTVMLFFHKEIFILN